MIMHRSGKQKKQKSVNNERIYHRLSRWLRTIGGRELIKQGHQVVLHARNDNRAKQALFKLLSETAEEMVQDFPQPLQTQAFVG